MVFFVCESCNESLKKNQVSSHANRCKNCAAVTCVDCNVTFWGDDFMKHTSCVSEAERYEGSTFRGVKKADMDASAPSSGGKKTTKKMNPQDSWMSLIMDVAGENDAPPSIKVHLSELAQYSNIPRKEKQFKNFAINSLRGVGRNDKLVTEIYHFLDGVRVKRKEAADAENKVLKDAEKEKQDKVKAEIKKKEEDAEKEITKKRKREEGGKPLDDHKDIAKKIKKALKNLSSSSPVKFSELAKLTSLSKEIVKLACTSNKKKFVVNGKRVSLITKE